MAARLTYLESLRTSLHAILEQDPRAVVLGEDILDPYGGAFKVTQGLSTRFPDRVFTTPISEAAIVGVSVGLALRGHHPIAEIMFGDFVTLAADQLINHAAKYAAMYNGRVRVPLVVRTPMGGGRGYGPTHSQSLERLFLGIPHLTVLAPSHVHDAGALLQAAVHAGDPVLFVENKLLYPQPLLLGDGEAGLRRWEVIDAYGYPVVHLANYPPDAEPDVTVVAYGGMSRLLHGVLARMAARRSARPGGAARLHQPARRRYPCCRGGSQRAPAGGRRKPGRLWLGCGSRGTGHGQSGACAGGTPGRTADRDPRRQGARGSGIGFRRRDRTGAAPTAAQLAAQPSARQLMWSAISCSMAAACEEAGIGASSQCGAHAAAASAKSDGFTPVAWQ